MPTVTYHYENGQELALPLDTDETILAISLKNGLAHHHACQGNARCTTCRIMVLEGSHHLTPRTPAEHHIAQQRNWPEHIRLACQTKAKDTITLRQLVIDPEDVALIAAESNTHNIGYECSLCVMFCDIAQFTPFSATHLPYDVIHLLNRYYKAICEPILTHQGYIDKYMGDGIMVLFGLNQADPAAYCLDAVKASLAMQRCLIQLNQCTLKNFGHTFNMRIGLHYGLVIVGEIGHPAKRQLTALGDTVNIASRIESMNKTINTTLLASQALLDCIQNKVVIGQTLTTQLRGQHRPHTLYEIIGLKA